MADERGESGIGLKSIVSSTKRRTLRIATTTSALLFGAWIGTLMWPLWMEYQNREPAQTPLPAAPSAIGFEGSLQQVAPEVESNLGLGGTDSSVAESSGTLVLRATHLGADGQLGSAEIGIDPNNPQVFLQGAILANGARLAEIHDNRVVFERGGSRATLYVTEAEFQRSGTTEAPEAASRIAEAQRQKRVSGDRTLATVGGVLPPVNLVQPAGGRSGFIRTEQIVTDGLVQGYRVTPGADAGRFSQAGFRAGDIVTALDGMPIDSQARVSDLIASISRGDLRTVTVLRGDVTTTLTLDGAPAAGIPSGDPSGTFVGSMSN